MVFESLALLIPRPVHEESVGHVNHEDGANHLYTNSQSGDASQQAEDETQPAKKFSADDKKRDRSGHTHLGEESHCAVEAIAAKPAQHLLRAVSEVHHS